MNATLVITIGRSRSRHASIVACSLPVISYFNISDGPTIAGTRAHVCTNQRLVTDAHGIRWFRTDDVGHVDDDGRLHVDGRLDDLINTGGLKVAPRVVEEAIAAHVPGVREVVVVGTPHPEWGQAVSALVVVGPGAAADPLTAADLRASLRGILPAHALPVRALQVAEVPLTGPGKPDRRSIAAMFTMG